MGKGVALQAKNRWPEIDQELANAIEKFGNVPCFLGTVDLGDRLSPDPYGIGYQVWSFPTKNHWRDPSSLDLIGKSCKILVEKIDKWNQQNPKVGITSVGMPRPGVGLGGLDWLQVRYVISKILDDRFTICTL
jgi:O-acetyl-ADP-ribose deacetylase (regulator of RNase III)